MGSGMLGGILKYAGERGLRVHATHMPPGVLGYYEPAAARIWFDLSLTPAERHSVIAHEIGHHHYGHTCDGSRAEREADFFAASLLVDPEEYARLERISTDVNFLADEFGVTVQVIRDFQRYCLKRIGDRVYSKRTRDGERRIA